MENTKSKTPVVALFYWFWFYFPSKLTQTFQTAIPWISFIVKRENKAPDIVVLGPYKMSTFGESSPFPPPPVYVHYGRANLYTNVPH